MGSSAVFGQKPATTSLPAGNVVRGWGRFDGGTPKLRHCRMRKDNKSLLFLANKYKIKRTKSQQQHVHYYPALTGGIVMIFDLMNIFYYFHTQKLCIFIWNLINEIDYFSWHFIARFLQLFTFYRFIFWLLIPKKSASQKSKIASTETGQTRFN